MTPFTILASTANLQSASPMDSRSRDVTKLSKAAGEFEAILLDSLWKSMKGTFSTSEDSENGADFDPTLENFDGWGMEAMSRAVGSAGGLGFKALIMQHLGATGGETDHGQGQTL